MMKNIPLVILIVALFVIATQCNTGKGHFTSDGSFYVWDKDPSGRYNAQNPLQLEASNRWVQTVLPITNLKKLEIDAVSKKYDDYKIIDSIMFFGEHDELANYHSYKTFARRLGIDSTKLKSIVMDFDRLGLNRFYREDKYLAFKTRTYLTSAKGYFYFIDTTLVKTKGDTINIKNLSQHPNFREAIFGRFLVLNKIDDHWVEWEQVR